MCGGVKGVAGMCERCRLCTGVEGANVWKV